MIDFEKDQQNTMKKTDNIQSLADQVEKLESLQKRLELQEENMKSTKKQLEHISGEVIPTMMSEMGLSHQWTRRYNQKRDIRIFWSQRR